MLQDGPKVKPNLEEIQWSKKEKKREEWKKAQSRRDV